MLTMVNRERSKKLSHKNCYKFGLDSQLLIRDNFHWSWSCENEKKKIFIYIWDAIFIDVGDNKLTSYSN